MKKIRKLLPLSLYDGPGLESWLESQAEEGLFPVKLGYFQAVFSPNGGPAPASVWWSGRAKRRRCLCRSGNFLKKQAGSISDLFPTCTIFFILPIRMLGNSIPTR